MIAPGPGDPEGQDKHRQRCDHADQHGPRPAAADEHAVEHERGHPRQGQAHGPDDIDPRRGDHRRVGAEAGRQPRAAKTIDQRDQHRAAAGPDQNGADQPIETGSVAGAQGLAAQHLGRALETVQQQGREHEQLVEDGVGRQHRGALLRPCPGQQHGGGHQQQGPREQVAVEAEQGHKLARPPGGRLTRQGQGAAGRPFPGDHDRQGQQLEGLGAQGGDGHAGHAQMNPQDQGQVEGDMEQVRAHLHRQHRAHAPPTDQPADQHRIEQPGDATPIADMHIGARQPLHRAAGAQHLQAQLHQPRPGEQQ